MAPLIKLQAPAKINLRLEVLGELPNRYHLLRMFNLTIDLCDLVEINFAGKDISVEVDDPQVPPGKDNLVYRAAVYFREKYGIEFGAKIGIRKHIPAGAGLAGGSSDAAAALKALAQKFKVKSSALELEEIAYKIGADVPYLMTGGPAWVSGVGEKIEPVPDFPPAFYLLVKPSFSLSTSEVYSRLGTVRDLTIEPKAVILSRLKREGFDGFCVNHLERAAFAMHQKLGEMKQELVRLGAQASLMSGSGSTLVGIFLSRAGAEKAARAFAKNRPGMWLKVVAIQNPRGAGIENQGGS